MPVPVLGAGSAGAAVALAYGWRVGLLTITETAPEPVARTLGRALAAVARPRGVRSTVDLLSADGRAASLEAADGLARKGADVILLGCTGMSTIGIAGEIRGRLRVPVVDPVLASALLARHLLSNALLPEAC